MKLYSIILFFVLVSTCMVSCHSDGAHHSESVSDKPAVQKLNETVPVVVNESSKSLDAAQKTPDVNTPPVQIPDAASQGLDQKTDNPLKLALINVKKVAEVLDILNPTDLSVQVDASLQQKVADMLGGIGKIENVDVKKDVFVVFGGLENQINYNVSAPTVIVTYAGMDNVYKMTRTRDFKGDVFFLTFQSAKNKYEGAKALTFAEFRTLAGGL